MGMWFEARKLADAVVRLAVAFPDEFRPMAETSLTMPSLRSSNPEVSCDAAAIASAVHLGERHAVPMVKKNRSRLGELCQALVAQEVEAVQDARRHRAKCERDAKFLGARGG